MESGTTIIGLIMLSLFILPVLIIARSGRNKGKRHEKDFFTYVSRNDLKISEKDFWDDYAIGIDKSQNTIIYISWDGPEKVHTVFKLKDVRNFETIPDYSQLNRKDFSYNNVRRLGFRFQFRDAASQELTITFYISEFGQITDNQIRLFKKWSVIIRDGMSDKQADNFRHSA